MGITADRALGTSELRRACAASAKGGNIARNRRAAAWQTDDGAFLVPNSTASAS